MYVNMNCVGNGNCSFKGKVSRTEQGNPYYKSSAGTTAGAIMAVPAGLTWINYIKLPTTKEEYTKEVSQNAMKLLEAFRGKISTEDKKAIDENIKNINDEQLKVILDNCKRLKKYAIPFAITAAGLTVGCGILVDHLRNKKARATADFVKQVGTQKALIQGDRASLSNNGRIYYDSNQGKKWGALLGAGCGLAMSLMSEGKLNGKAIGNMLSLALGGLIMGAITDSNSNKAARKFS